jgi:hypothetical protein
MTGREGGEDGEREGKKAGVREAYPLLGSLLGLQSGTGWHEL